MHGAFTVERLLSGEFDADLTRVAEQFKEFGRPMFFSTAREPNGVGSPTLGGFGPDGDQGWGDAEDLFEQFTPAIAPHPATPTCTRGWETRPSATASSGSPRPHRYYYDFFVRREGIDFLTFESMGWVVPTWDVEMEACFDWDHLLRSCSRDTWTG